MMRLFKGLAARFQAETPTPDEALVLAVCNRINRRQGPRTLSEQVIQLLVPMDVSVLSGGICEYLLEYEGPADALLRALQTVGAEAHFALLDALLRETGIQLGNHGSAREFEALYKSHREAFDRFDEAWYVLFQHDPLTGYAARYIRQHPEGFPGETG